MRYSFLLIFFGLLGCDSTTVQPEITPPVSPNPINFENLEAGQHSFYVSFNAGNLYDPENPTFEYISDTLMVLVESKTDSGFVFKEELTANSTSLQDVSTTSPATYHVKIENDFLIAEDTAGGFLQSNLFLINTPIPLLPITENEITLEGVAVASSSSDLVQSGFVADHRQFDHLFDRLNILINNSQIVVDGPALTMVYSREAGLVRVFSTSVWTGESLGWDLLL